MASALTDEQEKAAAERKAQSEVLERIRSGDLLFSEIVKTVDHDEVLKKIQVGAVLRAIPGMGTMKCARVFELTEISPDRRMGSLSDRQLSALSNNIPG